MEATAKVHVFEAAGLGIAPFRVKRAYRDVGPHITTREDGLTVTTGSPGQPMGSCKFCGQGIADCYLIRSADGREFTVGSDCVMRTGDAGMKATVNKHKAQARRDAQALRIATMAVEFEAARAALAGVAHPTIASKSMVDYVEWMMRNAGNTGRERALKLALKSVPR